MIKKHARREKKLIRLVKQVKLRSFRTSPKCQYGFQVPKNYGEVCRFDEPNGNDKWTFATTLEMTQLKEYEVFIERGEFQTSKIPEGFKKIKVHLIFAIKHDGRHKAWMVADGHLTDVPLGSVYSGVVSLRGLCIGIFLTKDNLEFVQNVTVVEFVLVLLKLFYYSASLNDSIFSWLKEVPPL